MSDTSLKPLTARPRGTRMAMGMSLVFVGVLCVFWIRTAWISDDAMISLRQVVNLFHGLGLTWDGTHRIQAFTHPSWFFLVTAAYGITGELFYTILVLSIIVSIIAVGWAIRLSIQGLKPRLSVATLATLAGSSSFIDYSTSGLENALTVCLLGWIVWTVESMNASNQSRPLVVLSILGALLLLNRLDMVLVIAPIAGLIWVKHIGVSRRLVYWSPGLALLVGWFTFATIYFGTPLPNTYYAKLHTGYPSAEYWTRGLDYLWVSLAQDPVGALLFAGGTLIGFFGSSTSQALSLGSILYGLYIIQIGGDFMMGRFIMPLVYLGAINVILTIKVDEHRLVWPRRVYAVATILALTFGSRTMFSGAEYANGKRQRNIADERGFYYQKFGLLSKNRQWPDPAPAPPLTRKSPVRTLCGQLGHTGLGMKAPVRLIDTCGLTDGLIARIPALHTPYWRIGHPERKVPKGYANALAGGRDAPHDPSIRTLFEDIEHVTTGPLFSAGRWAAIYRLNISSPYSVDKTLYSNPHRPIDSSRVKRTMYERIRHTSLPDGTPYRRRGNIYFRQYLRIEMQTPRTGRFIELSLDSNDAYDIVVNHSRTHRIEKSQKRAPKGGLVSHRIPLISGLAVESIFIVTLAGDGRCALGHLSIKN